MATNDLARLHLIVTGRVQGVFFRRAAMIEARRFGVKGFARNRPDGSVEIVAEGSRHNLELLLAWAHHGPQDARVDEIRAEWAEFSGEFADFKVR